ncbi:MAG: hypothetical protein ACLP9S_17090 [Syntrophales bacterium]
MKLSELLKKYAKCNEAVSSGKEETSAISTEPIVNCVLSMVPDARIISDKEIEEPTE